MSALSRFTPVLRGSISKYLLLDRCSGTGVWALVSNLMNGIDGCGKD